MRIRSTDALVMERAVQDTVTVQRKQKPVPEEKNRQAVIANENDKGPVLSEKTVIQTIESANKAIDVTYRRFEFSIHEKTKEIMVKVIDTETDEVIREIPPEKILDMVAMMWEMVGIIIDERR